MISFVTFAVSGIAIVALFILKHKEVQKGSEFFASKQRALCDARITRLEEHCSHKCTKEHVRHMIAHGYNTFTHKFAKVTASIAKKVEWRARSVAHKSAKARDNGNGPRENEYLADVQNHKDSLNTTKVAEEAKL